MKNKSIDGRIALVRLDKRITRSHLAKRVGISLESLGRYERGERQISAVNLLKIATLLDCSLDDLLGKSSASAEVAE